MRLSLFSRLTAGYLAIFLLVAGTSAFAVLQLHRFDTLTESILSIDNRILDYEKILTDLLYAQSRIGQRYVITKDEALHDQFLRLKEDFQQQLAQASRLGGGLSGGIFSRLGQDYQRYEEMAAGEAALIRAQQAYPQADYKKRKDEILDRILASLQEVKQEQQRAMVTKVRNLAEAASQARRVSLIIAGVCLLAIVSLSLFITRSITGPMALLKEKTREIAAGRFAGGVKVAAPREIEELAAAFNVMCEKLAELDRMKADFFAAMAHELRTPLTCVKESIAQLLDGVGGETTDRQKKLLTILAEESDRLIGVVNSLLDLSKMEAGMMRYDFETASIEPLIRQAVLEITPLAEAKLIALESVLARPLPAARLDPERILQVLRNLLGNAVKFTPKGGEITVAARTVVGKLEVSVKDSGPGIPTESLATIFEKYIQGHHKGPHDQQGTGLGLAIAKNVIASHGGEIWAESKVGRGSTFFFVLPC